MQDPGLKDYVRVSNTSFDLLRKRKKVQFDSERQWPAWAVGGKLIRTVFLLRVIERLC
jgi:hypothetical protein